MKLDHVACYIRVQLEYSNIFQVKAILLVLRRDGSNLSSSFCYCVDLIKVILKQSALHSFDHKRC